MAISREERERERGGAKLGSPRSIGGGREMEEEEVFRVEGGGDL